MKFDVMCGYWEIFYSKDEIMAASEFKIIYEDDENDDYANYYNSYCIYLCCFGQRVKMI